MNKVLIRGADKWIQHCHELWAKDGEAESKQLSFYERMKIDQMIRDKKNPEKTKATPELSESDSSETHSVDEMDQEK